MSGSKSEPDWHSGSNLTVTDGITARDLNLARLEKFAARISNALSIRDSILAVLFVTRCCPGSWVAQASMVCVFICSACWI
jgi:hypothetical protein